MRKLVATTLLTLDGVMQSPVHPRRIPAAAVTSAAVVILTYERGGDVEVGSLGLDQP
jgi:hypothetical protein